MDPRLQAKLLRVIQEKEVDRLGGMAPVKVDVRLLAATHRDLAAEVAKGRFREDLYFRLNVLALHIPPLRARPADILPLAEHFCARYARANGVPDRPLSAAARARLLAHPWPGNVRELENCAHRAVLLAEGAEIGPEAIELTPPRSPEKPAPSDAEAAAPARITGLVGRKVEEVERELIIETLSHCLGNRTRAAEILGISIRTLRNKLGEYRAAGIAVPPAPGQGPIVLPGAA
jgi:DNA-binding NtrC family response regulator